MTEKRHPIPPAPPAHQTIFTKDETCGYLRMRPSMLAELRRSDPTFPKPRRMTSALIRWHKADLDRWWDALPRGWSSWGGFRPKAEAAEEAPRG